MDGRASGHYTVQAMCREKSPGHLDVFNAVILPGSAYETIDFE